MGGRLESEGGGEGAWVQMFAFALAPWLVEVAMMEAQLIDQSFIQGCRLQLVDPKPVFEVGMEVLQS
jgi:hypothetical protein